MKKLIRNTLTAALILAATNAAAHFQTLIPNEDIITPETGTMVNLDLIFTHPMEWGPVMEMAPPVQFGVLAHGNKQDLRPTLKKQNQEGKSTYSAAYSISSPADYVFYVEPAPYWEPAEQKMIIHYTKVVVDAFGAEEGWDAMVGLPVEIEPLTRPYGLWTGNLFRGIVKKNGAAVPYAEVEVEYYNVDHQVAIPADPYATQVIKADSNGVFAYSMPKAGWWSFAALVDGDDKLTSPEGKPVDVELGGLIWVRTRDMADR
ncbi:MAG: DUF4198 domain-containing protein [Desulfobulbaceae bacterium]|nr:DUF4198 domain-containing protein [Desulfobulbaceae bacterium]HIJ79459.1 DUF4198 domain-containing protein [Deltaproteobacteria bacterium]